MRHLTDGDLATAVASLRKVLATVPAEEDHSLDAGVRRRLEGSVAAMEVLLGEPNADQS